MSSTVQAGVLRRIIDTATKHGANPDDLWQVTGATPAVDNVARLPAPRLFELWAVAARQVPRPLTLAVTHDITLEQLGVFGFALLTAPNFKAALRTVERFFPIITDSGSWLSATRERSLVVSWQRAPSRSTGQHMSTEATLAHFVACTRQVFPSCPRPTRVSLSHAVCRERRDALGEFLDCPVQVNTGSDVLEWDREFLDAVPRLANSAMHHHFVALATEQVSRASTQTSAEAVRAHLQRCIAEGEPTMSSVARSLGVSSRTLRRRLTDERTSYRTLLDDVRRQLSAQLLVETGLSVTRVALDLGFSDNTAFARAHRRWHGTSPRVARHREP